MVSLFLSPHIASPQSKRGKIRVLYKVTLVCSGNTFLILLTRPILWLIFVLIASIWSVYDIDWLNVTPRYLNNCVLSIQVTSTLTKISWMRFSFWWLPKITKLNLDIFRVRRFLENHSDTVRKSALMWCPRSLTFLIEFRLQYRSRKG